jgi:hypothetical protein
MIPKIKPEELENDLYSIKGTITDRTNVMFVDFQYSNTPITPLTSGAYPSVVSPNIFTKLISLDKSAFYITTGSPNIDMSKEIVTRELNREFIKVLSELGEKHREKEDFKRFDINVSDMKKKGAEVPRGIIAKILNLANLIAIQGRIGPLQYLIANNKTYNYILNNLGSNVNFMVKNGNLWFGNVKFIVDDSVEDDKILCGRKNSIDQPGIHCLILTDENGDILFQEYIGDNFNKKYIFYYKIVDLGFHPEYQYFKVDTRDIKYYRNMKLINIEKVYRNNENNNIDE